MVEKKKSSQVKSEEVKSSGKLGDIEEKIIELAKEGHIPAKIGTILRDKHGIPSVKEATGKRLCEIMKSLKITHKTEKNLIEGKITNLKGHIEKNKHDYTASRALTKQLWAMKKHSD